jgi:enolase-phosphatase E1
MTARSSGAGAPSLRRATILTDIEGTTTDVAFVHDVLFPFARRTLPELIRTRGSEPEIAAALDAARERAGAPAPSCDETIALLLRWIAEDRKETSLKTLQGIAWEAGYASGELVAPVYPDAVTALRAWHAQGHALAVYSSGSEHAQRLLFAHTDAGDLSPLFDAYFDTRVGAKIESASYARIAGRLGVRPADVLFLTDLAAEVAAARQAGCRVVRVDRARPAASPPVLEDGVAVTGSFAWIDPAAPGGVATQVS